MSADVFRLSDARLVTRGMCVSADSAVAVVVLDLIHSCRALMFDGTVLCCDGDKRAHDQDAIGRLTS